MRTQKIKPRAALVIGIFLLGMLFVSACSSQQSPPVTQEEPANGEDSVRQGLEITPSETLEEIIPTATIIELPVNPLEDPIGGNAEQSEGYPAPGNPVPAPTLDFEPYPSPEESAAPPPVKTGLEATNPSAVVLGAGKPQLIEFFAFW